METENNNLRSGAASLIVLMGVALVISVFVNLYQANKVIKLQSWIRVTEISKLHRHYETVCNISKAKSDLCDTARRGYYPFKRYYEDNMDGFPWIPQ